jgi:autotransporter translocation and assembly factor TamB
VDERPRQRRLKRLAVAGAIGLGLALVIFAAATALLRGERLGRLVMARLPAFAGTIELRSIDWHPRLWLDLLTDRPTPIVVEGLRIADPEGTDVLRAPRLELKVRPRSVLSGRVFLHDVKLGPGSFWRFGRMARRDAIGFLDWFRSGVPEVVPPTAPAPKDPDAPAFVFQIVNAELAGLDAEFDFPGSWGLLLRDIHAPASLLVEGSFVGWDLQKLVARKGGYLRILDDVLPFDHVEVARVATTREWPDNIFLDVTAARTGRSALSGRGMFTGIYGYGRKPGDPPVKSGIDMHAEISDAAQALAAIVEHRGIADLGLGGEGARLVLDLRDTFERLKIKGRLEGLDAVYADYAARRLGLEFALDLADPIAVTVQRLGFESPGGGSLAMTAELRGSRAKASLSFSRFTTDSYVPAAFRQLAAGILEGGLRFAADVSGKSVELSGMDLRLRRRLRGRAPRLIRIVGRASANPRVASTQGITVEVPGGSITAQGRFGVAHQVLGLALRATAADLPRLLTLVGLPPLARSARLSVDVTGSLAAPEVRGSVAVQQLLLAPLPVIESVLGSFRLQDGTAHLDSFAAQLFGGRLEASGTAKLFERTVSRWLKQPLLDLRVEGRGIDLDQLVPGGAVQGRLDFSAQASGRPRALSASLSVPDGTEVQLAGQRWRLSGVAVESDLGSAVIRTARLERLGGGSLQLSGRMAFGGEMSWRVELADMPVAALPGVAEAGISVGGVLAARFEVSGRLERPVLSGDVQLREVSARGVPLGDGDIRIRPTDPGAVAVEGQLFGRIALSGSASHGPAGLRLNALAEFRDLVLEELVPEMLTLGDARGRVSGSVRVTMANGPPAIDLRIGSLEVSAAREVVAGAAASSRRRLSLKSATDIHLVMAGDDIVLYPMRLTTDGVECRLSGEIHGRKLSGQVAGSINLELLQPFLSDRVDRLGGGLDLALRLGGTTSRPTAEGTVSIARPIAVKLPELEPIFTLPTGRVELDPTGVRISRLAIDVADARVEIEGRAGLDGEQNLTDLDLSVGGEVAGALLEALAGGALSEASGRARVAAQLHGTASNPLLNGRLDLKGLGFRLRELGRDVVLETGVVELDRSGLTLKDLQARVDGHGSLSIGEDPAAPGRVVLRRLFPTPQLAAVQVPLRGRRLSLVASSSVELDDVGFDLELSGNPQQGLALEGEVLVASGRYLQDFTVRKMVVYPNINESAVRPAYEGIPLLENLALDLRVRTVGDSFVVQNNLAPELHMVFDLHVHGTLSQPLIAGEVRPTDGRFHIFGVRGEFALVPNVNHITFVDTKSIERGETPELNLEAEAIVVDSTSREHVVRMRISGPVSQAQIDLSSNTGLDRNQATLLLLSGRTSEQDTVFGGTPNATLGANVRTGTDVIGQISRDSVADFLEPYIDDTLQLITGGKVNLRPTFGPDGFELRLERIGRQFDFQLSLRRGLDSQKQYRAESSLWLMDYLTLRGFLEQVTFTPQEGIIEDARSLRLELTLDFPIRPFLR